MNTNDLTVTLADSDDSAASLDLVPVAGTTENVLAKLTGTDTTEAQEYVTLTRDEVQAIIEEQRVLGGRYTLDSIIIGLHNAALSVVQTCGRTNGESGRPCVADAFSAGTLFDLARTITAQFYGEDGSATGTLDASLERDLRSLTSYNEQDVPSTNPFVRPLDDMLYKKDDGTDNMRAEDEAQAEKAAKFTLAEWRAEYLRHRVQRIEAKGEAGNGTIMDLIASTRTEEEAMTIAQSVATGYRDFLVVMLGQEMYDAVVERVGAERFDKFVGVVDPANDKVNAAIMADKDTEVIEALMDELNAALNNDAEVKATYDQIDMLAKYAFRHGKLPEEKPEEQSAREADDVSQVLNDIFERGDF